MFTGGKPTLSSRPRPEGRPWKNSSTKFERLLCPLLFTFTSVMANPYLSDVILFYGKDGSNDIPSGQNRSLTEVLAVSGSDQMTEFHLRSLFNDIISLNFLLIFVFS